MIKRNIISPTETPCATCSKRAAITLDRKNQPICMKCLEKQLKVSLSQLGSSPEFVKRHN